MNEYENMTKEELLTRCLFLDEVVAERNEQIEKMKCCENCKYENKSSYKHECLHTSKRCSGYENWELAE